MKEEEIRHYLEYEISKDQEALRYVRKKKYQYQEETLEAYGWDIEVVFTTDFSIADAVADYMVEVKGCEKKEVYKIASEYEWTLTKKKLESEYPEDEE